MLPIDMNSFLVGAALVLAVFLAFDLLVAGGAMSCGLASGIAGMMGTPWGWLVLVLLAGALLLGIAGR